MKHRLYVTAAVIRYQAAELPDGRLIGMEMQQPATGYAVIYECGGSTEVLSIHSEEETAVNRCKVIASHMDARPTGGVVH